jgi:uroporphyrinogen-III synthase
MSLDSSSLSVCSLAVTHEVEPSDALVDALQGRGAEVLPWSTVKTVLVEPDSTEEVLSVVQASQWLVVTSRRAVESVADWIDPLPQDIRVAAVGKRTAEAAVAAGWPLALISRGAGAADLARALRPRVTQSDRVVLLASDRAGHVLEQLLTDAVKSFHRFTVYRTERVPVDASSCAAALIEGSVDAVTFLSPSAAEGLTESLDPTGAGHALRHIPAVSIGPETTRALIELGFRRIYGSRAQSKSGVAERVVELLGTTSSVHA